MAHKLVSITTMALVLVLVLTLSGTVDAATLQVQGTAARHSASSWLSPSWLGVLLAHILPGQGLSRSTGAQGSAVDPNRTTRILSSCPSPLFPLSGTTNQGSACDPNG